MALLRVGTVTLERMRGDRPVESPRPGFVLWDRYLVVFLGLVPTVYLCGVEGAEREGSLRKGGGESGAPSSLSHHTVILYAGGSPR